MTDFDQFARDVADELGDGPLRTVRNHGKTAPNGMDMEDTRVLVINEPTSMHSGREAAAGLVSIQLGREAAAGVVSIQLGREAAAGVVSIQLGRGTDIDARRLCAAAGLVSTSPRCRGDPKRDEAREVLSICFRSPDNQKNNLPQA